MPGFAELVPLVLPHSVTHIGPMRKVVIPILQTRILRSRWQSHSAAKESLTLEGSNLSLLESTLSSGVKHPPRLEGLNSGPMFHVEKLRLGGAVSL